MALANLPLNADIVLEKEHETMNADVAQTRVHIKYRAWAVRAPENTLSLRHFALCAMELVAEATEIAIIAGAAVN